jgi:hypothetical protein
MMARQKTPVSPKAPVIPNAPAIPDSLTVQVSAVHPAHGTFGYAELLEGVVTTRHGPASVSFLIAQRLAGDVAESAKFAISFRTENHSDGVTYRVDAAELLGGIVRAYFEERSNDRPLPDAENEEPGAAMAE